MSGDDAASIGFDAELGLRSGADPIGYVGPVRSRYESLQGAADHTLRHGLNELSEAPIAVQDVAAACQREGAFLHFLDEKAVGLIRRFQRVNPRLAVGPGDDDGIDISIADGIEGLPCFAQLLPKRVVLPAQGSLRVILWRSTGGSGRPSQVHLPIVVPLTGMRSRP